MRKPVVYLAGAIRDGHIEDVEWREQAIKQFKDIAVVLNPLAGKKIKLIHGIGIQPQTIVKEDFWCVDNADVLICNFLSFADGYNAIGTLTEFGRATARGCLIYTIIPKKFEGHKSARVIGLHPFIDRNSALVFHTVGECIDYLRATFKAISGKDPHYFTKGEEM